MLCIFCKSKFHGSEYCDVYSSVEARKIILGKKEICEICISPEAEHCPKLCNLKKKCYICFCRSHPSVLCPGYCSFVMVFVVGTDSIAIEEALLAQNAQNLINFCYPPEWLQRPKENAENLCGSAILCPTNSVVQQINNYILSRMNGNERIFESIDAPLLDDPFKDLEPMSAAEIDQSMETMNKIETAGLPPHKLRLKVGAIVMLIKNLSVSTGLCNGTRMQITDFNDSFIKCKVLTGPLSKNKDEIFIPRCKFSYGGNLNEKGIRFTRLQFPVKLSFAITINKAQGQTLERLGLYFRSGECFAHGQLYTAMSRVRAKASLKVMTADETKNTTKNTKCASTAELHFHLKFHYSQYKFGDNFDEYFVSKKPDSQQVPLLYFIDSSHDSFVLRETLI